MPIVKINRIILTNGFDLCAFIWKSSRPFINIGQKLRVELHVFHRCHCYQII